MCGIVGFSNAWHDAAGFPAIVLKMLGMIRHRGPDEFGYYYDDQVAFGTARLSILDFAYGQQPLASACGRYWIAYNGEVYNYVELRQELMAQGVCFLTKSDTEVVLNVWVAWGRAGLARLNGAYGFVIHDRITKETVLGRDRFGKRPLFYTMVDGALVFASETKCFLEYPGFNFEMDAEILGATFLSWAPLPGQSIFKGVSLVPAGSILRCGSSSALKIESYASFLESLHRNRGGFVGSEREAIRRTRERLTDSVKLRLRSEVEVGSYLSGGLDSSIVTSIAARLLPHKLHTFSVSFEDTEFDESADQEALSKFLGTMHTDLRVSNSDIADAFGEALWHAEVPVFRTALVPMYLLSRCVRDNGIKVVLTGEGADELFLGYDIFKEALVRSRWDSLDAAAKKSAVSRLYPYLRHFSKQNAGAIAEMFSLVGGQANSSTFSHEIRFHNSRFSLRMLKDSERIYQSALKSLERLASNNHTLSLLERAQCLEFETLLGGYLLSSQGDRMALGNGVENRCPFLDAGVVDWANSLSEKLKLCGGLDEKYILRRSFIQELPCQITAKPKQPYRAPDAAVFKGRRMELVEDVLEEAGNQLSSFLDIDFCRRLLAKVSGTLAKGGRISPREDQAFLFLSSSAVIHEYFVRRGFPARSGPVPPVVVMHDGRSPR